MMPRLRLRFVAALLVSLLLHVALPGGWLQMPEAPPAPASLVAHLAPAPPPAPAPPATTPAPSARVAQPGAPQRLILPPTLPAAPSFALPAETDATEPEGEIAQSMPEAPAPAMAEVAAEPATPASAPSKTLPRKGRIAYTMSFGPDGFTVGKTVQTWELDADGYTLGSVSETTGIVELFGSQRHVYLSQGRITPRGLEPDKFFMSRTRRGRTEAAQARFDWQTGTLTLGRVPHQRGAALSAGTQDIVSFMYHLALSPPETGRIRMPITNGSRFETYEIDVLSEERIETPLGMLRTLPIRQVPRPGAERVEIWLAVDYRHLPVKIRFFDREGSPVGEQIVSEIRISDE